eukprot:3582805-Rhodomonas_salina.3
MQLIAAYCSSVPDISYMSGRSTRRLVHIRTHPRGTYRDSGQVHIGTAGHRARYISGQRVHIGALPSCLFEVQARDHLVLVRTLPPVWSRARSRARYRWAQVVPIGPKAVTGAVQIGLSIAQRAATYPIQYPTLRSTERYVCTGHRVQGA